VEGYFDESKEPKGRVLRNILVVSGVHARLGNISLHKPYTWVKDEKFFAQGKLVERKAGESTQVVMKEWCEIREESPELFLDTCVMQQPAAVRDEVIIVWSQQELKQSLGEVPVLQQHDLLGTQWKKAARESAFALNILRTVIAGQMTAKLQLTDVISATMSHDLAKESVDCQRSLLKRKAVHEGALTVKKFGKREIVRVTS